MRMTLYLAIALAASLLANVWQLRHAATLSERVTGRVEVRDAQCGGQLDRASDANAVGTTAITLMQERLDQCEALRVADGVFARAALNGAVVDRERIAREYLAMRSKMTAAQAGDCKAWAAEPTCGVQP